MDKEFEPKFFPDNPLTKNPYKVKKRVSVPGEDTHPGPGLNELDGKVSEVDADNLLGEDD